MARRIRAIRTGCAAALRIGMAVLVVMLVLAPAGQARGALAGAATSRLAFAVARGRNADFFLREGPLAAHLHLRGGPVPRILFAFPAGDSGVALWFSSPAHAAHWRLESGPSRVRATDPQGRELNGVTVDVSLRAQRLRITGAVLSSLRILRDYELEHRQPAALETSAVRAGETLRWARDRLDGAAGYALVLRVLRGRIEGRELHADRSGRIALRVSGFTGEPPLHGLGGAQLLVSPSAGASMTRDTLSFLAYHEKLLAGSWRFDTYFGRDTLISLRLLMPVLAPTAVSAGLESVLARLSGSGEVAHEEDIGERAVLDHLEREGRASAQPVYDYQMIDSTYLLAPVAGLWLLQPGRSRLSAAAWLAQPVSGAQPSESRGAALTRNFRFVVQQASAFAAQPDVRHLLALKPGLAVGNWRDSATGLGGGRYPYDVDAVLVPAALRAIAALYASGLLAPFLRPDTLALIQRAAPIAQVWQQRAPMMFETRLAHAVALELVRRYAREIGVPSAAAVAALGADDLWFHALALDAAGAPIPILNSDEGFGLLFGELDTTQLGRVLTAVSRPFPAGLMTPVGLLVANPAYDPARQAEFSRHAYHGTVIWSWQQALLAAGLERQAARDDLPASLHEQIRRVQRTLWSAIEATAPLRNSELWSWRFAQGRYRSVPFGSAVGDTDESNAAQLWSTAWLALRPPGWSPGSPALRRNRARNPAPPREFEWMPTPENAHASRFARLCQADTVCSARRGSVEPRARGPCRPKQLNTFPDQ